MSTVPPSGVLMPGDGLGSYEVVGGTFLCAAVGSPFTKIMPIKIIVFGCLYRPYLVKTVGCSPPLAPQQQGLGRSNSSAKPCLGSC